MRILIADDDITSRVMLGAMLQKSGFEVVQTADGEEALREMASPDAPKLIILDWMMPGMDGLEVLKRIRAEEVQLPYYVIMLTSKSEKSDIIAGLEAGADDYLSKPFHPGELRARVEVGRRLLDIQAELLRTKDALQHEAAHDPLTGVLNRGAIEKILIKELSREKRIRDGLTVGIMDIDHFKGVNDTHGHLVGDEVICEVANLVRRSLREYDHLGRFGGEEFLVVSPGLNARDALPAFERIRSAIAQRSMPTRAGNLPVTVSMGIHVVRPDETMDDVLAAADTALYEAKNGGRNKTCLGNPNGDPPPA